MENASVTDGKVQLLRMERMWQKLWGSGWMRLDGEREKERKIDRDLHVSFVFLLFSFASKTGQFGKTRTASYSSTWPTKDRHVRRATTTTTTTDNQTNKEGRKKVASADALYLISVQLRKRGGGVEQEKP